jgi:pullulanase
MRLYLQDQGIKPGFDEIYSSHLYFRDILRIRKSTSLFRLRTGVEVRERVKFYHAGAEQHPLIAMAILDREQPALDPEVKSVVVFFNVDKVQKRLTLGDYVGIPLELHPVLQRSFADLVVKQARYESGSGTFIIPPRTTAVFVEKR